MYVIRYFCSSLWMYVYLSFASWLVILSLVRSLGSYLFSVLFSSLLRDVLLCLIVEGGMLCAVRSLCLSSVRYVFM